MTECKRGGEVFPPAVGVERDEVGKGLLQVAVRLPPGPCSLLLLVERFASVGLLLNSLRGTVALHLPCLQEEREKVLPVADPVDVLYPTYHVVGSSLHLLLGTPSDGLHLSLEVAHDLGIADAGQLFVAALLVFLAEDVAGEGLERPDDVPLVAAVQLFADIVHYPSLHLGLCIHCTDEAVNGAVYHLFVGELHLQVSCQPQLACHAPKDALEERVDGLDAEVRVVVQDGSERLSRLLANLRLGEGFVLPLAPAHNGIHVVIRFLQPHLQGIERLEDAALHLCRSLVGEGDGQRMHEFILGVWLQQSGNVFHGQGESLARARGCLVYGE